MRGRSRLLIRCSVILIGLLVAAALVGCGVTRVVTTTQPTQLDVKHVAKWLPRSWNRSGLSDKVASRARCIAVGPQTATCTFRFDVSGSALEEDTACAISSASATCQADRRAAARAARTTVHVTCVLGHSDERHCTWEPA